MISSIEKFHTELRRFVISFSLVFVLSVVVFIQVVLLDTATYLWILAVLLLIPVVYNTSSLIFLAPVAANVLAFFLVKWHRIQRGPEWTPEKAVIFAAIAVELLYLASKWLRSDLEQKHSENIKAERSRIYLNEGELLPTREEDLKRLKEYLSFDCVVGISGEWGTGKSYLADYFLKEHGQNTDVIKIGLFELNANEPANVFLWAIDNLLRKHGYFSRHSKAISNMLGSHAILSDFAGAVFPDYEGIDDSIGGIRDKLRQLRIPVYFVIEDLDRLKDAEKIRTVLSLCERLSGDNVKFIVEYDPERLKDVDAAFSYTYVEKFIPNTVMLTPVRIEEMFNFFLHSDTHKIYDKQMHKTPLIRAADDLIHRLYFSKVQLNQFFNQYGLEIIDQGDNVYPSSIRAVLNFLREMDSMVEAEKKDPYCNDHRINALSGILFVKYMDRQSYEKLQWYESPLRSLAIRIKEPDTWEQVVTIEDMIRAANEYQNLARLPEDHRKSAESNYLRIKNDLVKVMKGDHELEIYQGLQDLYILGYTFPVYGALRGFVIKGAHDNAEIDHIVQNQIANGIPEYTKEQSFVKDMEHALRQKDPDRAYEKLADHYYYEETYKHSKTIFRIGIRSYQAIFEAFYLCERNPEYWIKAIAFTKRHTRGEDGQGEELDPGKLVTLTFCMKFRNKKVFLKAVDLFLSWKVIVNFNEQRAFADFLNEFIDSMYVYGFLAGKELGEYGLLHDMSNVNSDMHLVKYVLDKYEKALTHMQEKDKKLGLKHITQEYGSLLQCLNRIREMLDLSVAYEPGPAIKISESATVMDHDHPEIYEALEKAGSIGEIDKAYAEGTINAAEAHKLVYGDALSGR